MNIEIDYLNENILFNEIINIPIHYIADRTEFNITENVTECGELKIPINQYTEIIIPEMNIDRLHFPETTTANNGFAKTAIHNNTNNTVSI